MTTPTPTQEATSVEAAKSLGEKLFDAMLDVSGETDLWAGIGAFEQAQTERIALAFAASLSHDETATATIATLQAENLALRASLQKTSGALQLALHKQLRPDHIVNFTGEFAKLGMPTVSEILDEADATLTQAEAGR